MIYLDHAASSRPYPEVVEFLGKSLSEDFANPNSPHALGKALNERISKARLDILKYLNASTDNYSLIFTSSASEANNIVLGANIKGLALLTSADHPSVVLPLKRKLEIKIREIPLNDDGSINFDQLLNFDDLRSGQTSLLALSHVNNYSGILYPVEDLAFKIKEINKNVHVHIDASQSFSKVPLSLENKKVDTLVISSAKMGGPKGVAALIYKKSYKISPMIWGGGQEMGFRAGTLNAPAILGMLKATVLSIGNRLTNYQRIKGYTLAIKRELKEKTQVLFPFEKAECSPYILSIIFPEIPSDIILRHLEQKYIYLSATSACSSKVKGDNKVQETLKIPKKYHKNIFRVSFSPLTTSEEVDYFIKTLLEIYLELKAF